MFKSAFSTAFTSSLDFERVLTPSSPLDQYTNIASAYSISRRLTSKATLAMRIRRDSDNSELDIGFLGGGEVDSQAIIDFAIGANAFVVVVYDQKLANDISQSNTSLQPKIYDATTGLIAHLEKPAIDSLTTATALGANFAQVQPYGYAMVWRPKSTVGDILVAGDGLSSFATFGFTADRLRSFHGATLNLLKPMLNQSHYSGLLANQATSTLYDNGDSITGNIGSNARNALGVAAYTNASQASDILFSELVVFDSNVNQTDLEAVLAEQNKYYRVVIEGGDAFSTSSDIIDGGNAPSTSSDTINGGNAT